MANLPISQLPLATSGSPDSLMVIVNYDLVPSGVTYSIPFSALTEQFSGSSGTSGSSGSSGTSGSDGTSGSSGSSGSSGTSGSDRTSGSSGSSGSSGTSGSDGTSGSSGSSGTSGTSAAPAPYPVVYGLFSQTSDSIPVSATTSESSIVGTGLGTLNVPPSGFTVGDSFSVSIMGHISSKNNDTLTIRIKSNAIVLGTIGPITMSQSNNKHFNLQIYFTIRNIGGAGTASILSGGQFNYSKDASTTFEGSDFTDLNNTTFDTTISNTLDITAQWSSADAVNSIYSEFLVLNKIY